MLPRKSRANRNPGFLWALSSLLCLWLFITPVCYADILVIVNKHNPVELNQRQLADMYLGKTRTYPNGKYALLFDLERDDTVREKFIIALTGKPVVQYMAYWARLMFSGRILPPHRVPNQETLVSIVRQNPNALGYISADTPHEGVRVVMEISTRLTKKTGLQ